MAKPFGNVVRGCTLVLALAAVTLAGCSRPETWNLTDITGSMPPLAFDMKQARDGKSVTAKDYQGKVVVLYFGYTYCPDVCPTELAHLAQTLSSMGKDADKVAVLFITIDPDRDTLKQLKSYVSAFAPQIYGLRGTKDDIAALARRYRVAYSITPAHDGKPEVVSHSSAAFIFDKKGQARLIATSVTDTKAVAHDLKQLVDE